jgi:hypothetical protein
MKFPKKQSKKPAQAVVKKAEHKPAFQFLSEPPNAVATNKVLLERTKAYSKDKRFPGVYSSRNRPSHSIPTEWNARRL